MATRRVLLAAVCFAFVGSVAVLYGATAGDNAADLERQLNELRKARVASAQKAVEAEEAAIQANMATDDSLLDVTRNLVDAELDLATTPEEEIAAWEKYVKVARLAEEKRKVLHELTTRGGEASEYYTAIQERQRAEIELLKAKLKAQ